jgi:hypothetical protein
MNTDEKRQAIQKSSYWQQKERAERLEGECEILAERCARAEAEVERLMDMLSAQAHGVPLMCAECSRSPYPEAAQDG